MVSYDPISVQLVNRLCEKTGARIVISSNWRYTVGVPDTQRKLISEGILEGHFHDAYACPKHFRGDSKSHDIRTWLVENREIELPEWPEFPDIEATEEARAEYGAAYAETRKARDEPGYRYVALDDEEMQAPHLIRTTYEDGITGSVYRIACRALGGVDPLMGVREIEDADMQRIMDAFKRDYLWAATFLESGDVSWRSRQLRGNPEAFWQAVDDELRYIEPEDADPDDLSDDF